MVAGLWPMIQESVVNSRRTIILLVAVVVGAVAAVGLLNYVRNAETSAGEAGAPVDIWVVKQPIPKGTAAETAIEQELIGQEQIPQRYRAATAVVEPTTELAGLVAVTDLAVNTQLVAGNFVSPTVIETGITDRLEDRGLVTVTFNVDQARGAAHLIEPGDFVNVLIERDWATPFFEEDPPIPVTESAAAELAAELEANNAIRPILTDLFPVESRVVYQKAEVLAVGNSLVPDIGQQPGEETDQDREANRGLITLAVPPEAVQVILDVGRDNIYLSLVPDDYEPRPLLPLDPTTQVLPGESQDRLTPYDGVEGVVNPALTRDDLQFAEPEDRIGTTPSSGGGTTEEPTTESGGRGATTTTTEAPAEDGEEPVEDEETTTTTVGDE